MRSVLVGGNTDTVRIDGISAAGAEPDLLLHTSSAALDLDPTVTDPGVGRWDHPATDTYVADEAKEVLRMGGTLALSDRADVSMQALHDRIVDVYDRLVAADPVPES